MKNLIGAFLVIGSARSSTSNGPEQKNDVPVAISKTGK
jgi:hypothetical protein